FRSARHRLFHPQHPCFLHRSTSLPSTVINQEAVVSPIIGTEGTVCKKSANTENQSHKGKNSQSASYEKFSAFLYRFFMGSIG
ncbi:MAG: hypothetical protein K8R46_00595, partial [Pirellulales bacterium]|nr:hypothetical protein [Pirellulales bacterium]